MKALASALSFNVDRNTICKRANLEINVSLPIILEANVEKIKKTKDIVKLMDALSLNRLVEKAKKNGTKSVLFVVSNNSSFKAASNLPGVDVVRANDLNVKDLAPGTHPGRLTVFSESAIPEIEKRFVQ
jgi:large subunit ribosomal protein L4e